MFLEAFPTTAATAAPTHLATLLNNLISTYFIQLNAVLIVHNSSHHSGLQEQYLNDVQLAFSNQSANGDGDTPLTGLLWIDVAGLRQDDFKQKILRAVDIVIEGFITILPDTLSFLHARYYATRLAKLRLKDKFHLFLCEEHENPEDLLATEILQFYPHHVMVRPERVQTKDKIITLNKFPVNDTNMGVSRKASQVNRVLRPGAAAAATAKPTSTSGVENKSKNPNQNPNQNQSQLKSQSQSQSQSQYRDINFELWTQKFFGADGNLDAIRLDAFLPNETFANNVELYPDKLSNLKGRTLKVGSITYKPYVVTNYVDAGTGDVDPIYKYHGNRSVLYIGSEANVMKTFCKIRNCHLRVTPYGADNWGGIFENETSTGLLGELYQQHVELVIGCIYNWYDDLTETSFPIARSSVTILGPAPSLTPPWYTNIAPFSTELWIVLTMTILISSIVFYLITVYPAVAAKKFHIHHIDCFEKSFLDVFAIFLQQSSATITLKQAAARIFLTVLMVAAITIENTYSGQLKSLLAVPMYTEPIDTMEKWSKTNWKWSAPSKIWVGSVEHSTLKEEQIIVGGFEVHDYDLLYNYSFRNDYGLGLERLMSGTFTFGRYITAPVLEKKIILKDDLYFDFTRAIAIRGWPLMPSLNEHILACMESGLYEQWERNNVVISLDRQIQALLMKSAYGHKDKVPPKKLNIESIAGAIFILIIGQIMATILFLLEIFRPTVKRTLWKLRKFLKIIF